jgi:3-oxoacyl-[acyl-carrier-protein] synthase II
MGKRRVVITGMGMVSPLGNTREETWKNVLAGKSGAAPITQFHADSWPTRIACEVKNFTLDPNAVPADHRKYLNRPSEFGAQAVMEAMLDSGLDGNVDPTKLGVSFGASIGAISPHGLSRLLSGMDIESNSDKLHNLSSQVESAEESYIVMKNHPGTLAAVLSARWQALGPSTTIHTACASSGQSLGQAYLQIQRGDCDAIIAGGADSLAGELLLAGFCLIGALSTRNEDPTAASRPFDKNRDGFVASEGASMMILEELEHAKARGAKIYAEISGYGETESAYRVTDLPENGRGIVEAMHLAIEEAELDPGQVNYINAHGTSTEVNDRIEALAVRRVFGSRGAHPMVSSTKSETGHLISAAGAMEAGFCTLAVRDGKVPPTRNLFETNCGDDIDFVAHEMREGPIDAALSNSIGFGGSNSSLAIVRYEA